MLKFLRLLCVIPLLGWFVVAQAETPGLQPFIEGNSIGATLADADKTIQAALTKGGFEVVGHYAPKKNVTIVSVTNPAMLKNAAATDRGAYGATISIALEEVQGKTFVTYMNPVYVANGYQMATDNADTAKALAGILGAEKTFGAKPRTPNQLRNFQYAFGMETFTDPVDLGSFPGFQDAEQKITSRLQAGKDGVGFVYKLKIPGKNEVIFGVDLAAKNADANGVHLIDSIDTGVPHRYAFLPYEVLLKDKNAEALNLRFCMALFFPDLPMMGGDASFFKLRNAPDAIKTTLRKALGGTVVSDSNSSSGGFGSF